MNISYIDITTRQLVPTTFDCCHCQCHYYINNNHLRGEPNSYLYESEKYQQQIETKISPLIF
jgi:hypothetical protein